MADDDEPMRLVTSMDPELILARRLLLAAIRLCSMTASSSGEEVVSLKSRLEEVLEVTVDCGDCLVCVLMLGAMTLVAVSS